MMNGISGLKRTNQGNAAGWWTVQGMEVGLFSDAVDSQFKLDYIDLVIMKLAMETFNIHEAKTHLSRLIERAAGGETVIIAKAGKPVVKLTALDAPTSRTKRRLGFMQGQFSVPDDFDTMGSAEIERMFTGDSV
jgi:prevent-host-death family protein